MRRMRAERPPRAFCAASVQWVNWTRRWFHDSDVAALVRWKISDSNNHLLHGGLQATPGLAGTRKVLTCFEAVAAGEDWALAWAARPVAAAGALPPRHCWSALRLKSPPHMATVLAHLQAVRPTPSAAPPPSPSLYWPRNPADRECGAGPSLAGLRLHPQSLDGRMRRRQVCVQDTGCARDAAGAVQHRTTLCGIESPFHFFLKGFHCRLFSRTCGHDDVGAPPYCFCMCTSQPSHRRAASAEADFTLQLMRPRAQRTCRILRSPASTCAMR